MRFQSNGYRDHRMIDLRQLPNLEVNLFNFMHWDQMFY